VGSKEGASAGNDGKTEKLAHIVLGHASVLEEGAGKYSGDVGAVESHEEEKCGENGQHPKVRFADDSALFLLRPRNGNANTFFENMTCRNCRSDVSTSLGERRRCGERRGWREPRGREENEEKERIRTVNKALCETLDVTDLLLMYAVLA
jgi:hypothetical protein